MKRDSRLLNGTNYSAITAARRSSHKEGKLQDAERLYRLILQAQPAHPHANHNLGLLAVSLDQAHSALSFFKIALQANPKIEQFWISYIDALIREKQFENAKQVIRQAKTHGLTEEKLNSLEAQLSSKNETPNITSASPPHELVTRLFQYYQDSRYGDAERLSMEVIRISQSLPWLESFIFDS